MKIDLRMDRRAPGPLTWVDYTLFALLAALVLVQVL